LKPASPISSISITVNKQIPEHHKLAGLTVKMSNLCSEITLPTGIDHLGNDRTAVCCLSSLNLLRTYIEWKDHPTFIEDVMRFLDNVLQDFIDRAPRFLGRAKYSAMRERSVGLGVMGFTPSCRPEHSVGIGHGEGLEQAMFKQVKRRPDAASVMLAEERGAVPRCR
jgi:ribonucleoside-diphosphate reductase alpha chain